MAEPLATVPLPHGSLRIHGPDAGHAKGFAVTVLPDGREVVAAPNGDDTLATCCAHELAHSLAAHALFDGPSVCLTAVADAQGRVWTDARRREEGFAMAWGPLLAAVGEGLGRAHDAQAVSLDRETPDAA